MCTAAVHVHAGINDATKSKLDSLFTPLASPKSPGLAVLVQKDGRTLFRKGYGVRDLRTLIRIDAKTDFRLASCTSSSRPWRSYCWCTMESCDTTTSWRAFFRISRATGAPLPSGTCSHIPQDCPSTN